MVLLVSLPLMVRGNSVQMRIMNDIFQLRVPNIYKLQLSLPVPVENEDCLSFFDCKIRKMIIVAPVQEPKTQEIFEEDDLMTDQVQNVVADQQVEEEEKVQEIEEPSAEESKASPAAAADDDLLFDVV